MDINKNEESKIDAVVQEVNSITVFFDNWDMYGPQGGWGLGLNKNSDSRSVSELGDYLDSSKDVKCLFEEGYDDVGKDGLAHFRRKFVLSDSCSVELAYLDDSHVTHSVSFRVDSAEKSFEDYPDFASDQFGMHEEFGRCLKVITDKYQKDMAACRSKVGLEDNDLFLEYGDWKKEFKEITDILDKHGMDLMRYTDDQNDVVIRDSGSRLMVSGYNAEQFMENFASKVRNYDPVEMAYGDTAHEWEMFGSDRNGIPYVNDRQTQDEYFKGSLDYFKKVQERFSGALLDLQASLNKGKDSEIPVELDMSEIDKKFKDRANGKDTGKGSR